MVRIEVSCPRNSLRLPEPMILRLKEQANERHVPYQSLIK